MLINDLTFPELGKEMNVNVSRKMVLMGKFPHLKFSMVHFCHRYTFLSRFLKFYLPKVKLLRITFFIMNEKVRKNAVVSSNGYLDHLVERK